MLTWIAGLARIVTFHSQDNGQDQKLLHSKDDALGLDNDPLVIFPALSQFFGRAPQT
jgi:hypothetical protein